METITFEKADGATVEIPLAIGFGPKGKLVFETGDLAPSSCDHLGACWSDCFEMRCPRCGAPMFMPPRFLARRAARLVKEMYSLWRQAGWPTMDMSSDPRWHSDPAHWTMVNVPAFAHVGGIPVLHGRLAGFLAQNMAVAS